MTTDVVLVNFNGTHDTIECLESLWRMDKKDIRVVVVDNASTSNSFRILSDFVDANEGIVIDNDNSRTKYRNEKLVLLVSTKNGGYAYGINLGIKFCLSNGPSLFFWLLNNDCIVAPNALSELIGGYNKQLRKKPNLNPGILGSKIFSDRKRRILQGVGGNFSSLRAKTKIIGFEEVDCGQYDSFGAKLDMVLGVSMFVDCNFINEVGLLNEEYFLYSEELDWSIRARKKGMSTCCIASSEVYHRQGQTTKNSNQRTKNPIAMAHMFSSLIKLYKNYYPRRVFVAYMVVFLRSTKMIVLGRLKPKPFLKALFIWLEKKR